MIQRTRHAGPIAWMARNSVAANLLMLVLILGGLFMMTKIRQEYLPNPTPDTVDVIVPLPGATPAEVEQSILLVLEDAVSTVQGIDKIRAVAREGEGSLGLELSGERSRELVYGDDLDLQNPQGFEPIGISCRICERARCHQRSVPPLERRLRVDPDRRGTLPYEIG